jgi:predicted FMN-binding regulatory protein PaiB
LIGQAADTERCSATSRAPIRNGDLKAAMLKAIVGFAIEIDRIEGKFKMGQNRPVEDQIGTVARLEGSSDPSARALAELTRKHLGLDAVDGAPPAATDTSK